MVVFWVFEIWSIRFKGLSNIAILEEYDAIKAQSQTSIDLEMVLVKLIQSNTYFKSKPSWCIQTYNCFKNAGTCASQPTHLLQIVMSNHILDI